MGQVKMQREKCGHNHLRNTAQTGCCSLTDETTTSGEDLVDSADKNLDVLFNVHKKVISNGGGSSSASTTGGGEDEEVISVGQFLRVRTVFTTKCTLGA